MLKNDNNKLKKFFITFLFILMECIFILVLLFISKKFLYSSYNKDLIIIVLVALFSISFTFLGSKKVFGIWKLFFIKLLLVCVSVICCFFSVFYIGKSLYAFRYENSDEVYRLSSNVSVVEAKKIKNIIDDIFEKDFDGVFSRDVIIDNYYYDEENDDYILYLADYYKNYKLKFYVEMDKFNVNNIYWKYNDDILYFVCNGEKTDNFEYYYAMYILNEVIGEEVHDVLTLEDTIEKKMKKKFVYSTNIIISYENLNYYKKQDIFILNCHISAMDFTDDVLEEEFEVIFNGVRENDHKNIWYYGDSSFDFVNYNINI